MQKRDEEGPHLAEVYRIKMWLRCLPSPRLMARFFARQTITPVAQALGQGGHPSFARRLIAVSR